MTVKCHRSQYTIAVEFENNGWKRQEDANP